MASGRNDSYRRGRLNRFQVNHLGWLPGLGRTRRRCLSIFEAGRMMRKFGAFFLWLGAVLFSCTGTVLAQPVNWQVGLQAAASERMERITSLHTGVLIIITFICLLVLGLLVVIAVRFNAKANPTPSATTHNTMLEVLWTIVPVLILISIAVPSFRLLYFEETIPPVDLTVKAIGKQWYWSYEYPDNGNFTFDALVLPDRKTAPAVPGGEPRLLGTT